MNKPQEVSVLWNWEIPIPYCSALVALTTNNNNNNKIYFYSCRSVKVTLMNRLTLALMNRLTLVDTFKLLFSYGEERVRNSMVTLFKLNNFQYFI